MLTFVPALTSTAYDLGMNHRVIGERDACNLNGALFPPLSAQLGGCCMKLRLARMTFKDNDDDVNEVI